MQLEIDDFFWNGGERQAVFQVFPQIYGDGRGFFCEILNCKESVPPGLEWFKDFSWIKQANRSLSGPGVIRGMHAQSGASCQGKLVQALTKPIYDVISDARPDSPTFGKTKSYLLDPAWQNMLWVPRGFLHGFCVSSSDGDALFEYFCDNVYDKESEIGVFPLDLMKQTEIKDLIQRIQSHNDAVLSQKDMEAQRYSRFSDAVRREYEVSGRVWYR